MFKWLLVGSGIFVVAACLYWLLITTEGAYLGRRVVVWLYDISAHRYDAIKGYDPRDEYLLVTRPVLEVTAGVTEPLLLDVATGTGRVPFDLLLSDTFNGRIVGIDASRKMLALAAAKLAAPGERVLLVRHTADPLPFATATFDVVTCLESLEFFPSDEAALQEMKRVLRPGRYLLTTRRRGWEGKSFVGRYRSRDNMRHLLAGLDFYNIGFHPWQVNYDLVTARKPVHL